MPPDVQKVIRSHRARFRARVPTRTEGHAPAMAGRSHEGSCHVSTCQLFTPRASRGGEPPTLTVGVPEPTGPVVGAKARPRFGRGLTRLFELFERVVQPNARDMIANVVVHTKRLAVDIGRVDRRGAEIDIEILKLDRPVPIELRFRAGAYRKAHPSVTA